MLSHTSALQNCFVMVLTILLWTATSYTCHFFAKCYLNLGSYSQNRYASLVITNAQLVCLYSTLEFRAASGASSSQNYATLFIVFIAHAIGTLSTNMSLNFVEASAVMGIKVMEPISTSLMQKVICKKSLAKIHFLTVPMICIGVSIFLQNSNPLNSLSLGLVWGLLSNVSYGLRNIYLKELKSQNVTLSLRRFQDVLLFLYWVIFIGGLMMCGVTQDQSTIALLGCIIWSSLFHLLYTYVSIARVLSFVSVITHAVFNVTKRILVVILFAAGGQVVKTSNNWVGLVLAAFGMVLHFGVTSQKTENKDSPSRQTLCGKFQIVSSSAITLLLIASQITAPYLITIPKLNITLSDPESPKKQINIASNLLEQHHLIRDKVIQDIQQIQFDHYDKLLQSYSKVALICLADFENKGDPAIAVGQLTLLKQFNATEVIYYNLHRQCRSSIEHAKEVIERHPVSEVLIIWHGGGNLFAWVREDELRRLYFNAFPNHSMAIFPQSIWVDVDTKTTETLAKMYNSRDNLFLAIRDPQSMKRAKELIPKANLTEVPDIAFQIGPVPRTRSPVFDILYLKRTDKEGLTSMELKLPPGISYQQADWLEWKSASPQGLDIPITILNNGFSFLQRGKVIITDRLHGHILSTLVGIPHVIMEAKSGKVLPLHYKWTKDIPFVRVAKNVTEAVDHALELLHTYAGSLPDTLTFDAPFN